MKVISIREPWASLILNGYKEYEFRSWKTKFRGEIYIHTSKLPEKENIEYFKDYNLDIKNGYIIGKVILEDCILVTKEFEDKLIKKDSKVYGRSKNRGGYAFKVSNPIKIEPIPAKGQLGIWEYKK